MVLSKYSCQDCPDAFMSTGSNIVFYQGVTIDNFTDVPGLFFQSSSESEYNVSFTVVIALSQFIMLNNELMNKDPYVVP